VRKLMMEMVVAVGTVALATVSPAAAQDVLYHFEREVNAGPQADFFALPVPPAGPEGIIEQRMGLLAVEPFDIAQPVTGAPYSADIVTEVVQTLADGNRIERQTTSSVARDGQGRVRREQQLAAIGPILPQVEGRFVTIMNPVDGVHYSLDPARKVAMRSPMPVFKQADPVAGSAGSRVFIGGGAGAGVASGIQTVFARRGLEEGRTESLGTAVIEGVEARGSRTVVTIPAGSIGNLAPIEMVSERWLSPELGVVVMSRRSDPRFGETTYRLQNVVRGEPSPDLFQVPADYTLEAVPVFGGERLMKPARAR
jgi:hypothetical protein